MIIHQEKNVVYQLALASHIVEESKRVRHEVFLDEGYIDAPFPDGVIPDTRDNYSEYIAALDSSSLLVLGTMRLTPLAYSQDLFDKWQDHMLDGVTEIVNEIRSQNTVELGALAVKRVHRRRVSWGLYKSTLRYSLSQRIDHWLIAIDDRALRSLEILGWKIDRIGESIMYMGSKTTLAVMPVAEQLPSISMKNKAFLDYLTR